MNATMNSTMNSIEAPLCRATIHVSRGRSALPGAYPNLLGPDCDERALASYGTNLDRLLAAKDRYDPDNVFASAIPGLRGYRHFSS